MVNAERKLRLQVANELEGARTRTAEQMASELIGFEAWRRVDRVWVEAISIVLGEDNDGDDAQD